MRVAVWRTGHEIADTVADAVGHGLKISPIETHGFSEQAGLCDVNIGYGILRGMEDVFKTSDRFGVSWLNIDRGYINPHHYDGYYRVSLCGTQQTTGLDRLKPDYDRLKAPGVEFKPWRGLDESKPVLVIPPTDYVTQFFKLPKWLPSCVIHTDRKYVVRTKADASPINFDDYSHVVTFNSSIGWQAIAAGIPCISDPTHSFVGAYYKQLLGGNHNIMDNCAKAQQFTRHELFGCMASLQLTLDEMRAGKIWELMTRLMSSSDMIAEKPSALTSQPTPSANAQVFRSIYTT